MTVELLQTLSLVAYIAAGVLLLVSIVLFFLYDVVALYNDLSGRTARKAIEEIRRQNEASGNKAYKTSAVNAERGKLTDKITPSGRLERRTAGLPVSVGTEKFDTALLAPQVNETTVLEEAVNETTVLEEPAGETTLLVENAPVAGETAILVQEEPAAAVAAEELPVVADSSFAVDVEMSFAESAEIIE